jgi:hypothetical protein
MAYEIPGFKLGTLLSDADLSASQFRFVNANADGEVIRNVTAGADVLGVLNNKPNAAGQACEIVVDGVAKVVAGAAITLGANGTKVMSDNQGRAVAATATNKAVGYALAAAGAAGEIIPVLLLRMGTQ